MGTFKPLMLPLYGSYPASIAIWGGAPIRRVVVKPNKVDNFSFLGKLLPHGRSSRIKSSLSARSQVLVQLLHINQ